LHVRWFFAFFLISGFCGLVDEVVWLRIAMAQFGVVTPLVSTVLSVFMAGLALGSWWGGRLSGSALGRRALSSLRLYAAAELIIATSAFFVPLLLRVGRDQLLRGAADAVWGSPRYHLASGAWIALALLPFCVCMGATFPLAMAAIREAGGEPERRTFGHLYVANVLGATCGTIAAAFVLVELLGFEGTLRAVALLNVLIGAGALVLSAARVPARADAVTSGIAPEDRRPGAQGGGSFLTMLFVTGLSSMAMEVVWVRQFTPYLGTVVYAFATILALYLGATFLGSTIYRLGSDPGRSEPGGSVLGLAWAGAGLYGLLTLVATDPRLPFRIVDPAAPQPGDLIVGAVRVALGLTPFCCAMGFITPMLVDRYSAGDPERAGRAYAINVLGCIVGPLVACFGLLPAMRACRSIDLGGLREGARTGGGRKERLRSTLVVAEVMASVVLLVSAGLLVRALWRLQATDPGFRVEQVISTKTTLARPLRITIDVRCGERASLRLRGRPGYRPVSSAQW